MKLLVLGGTRFLGRHIVQQALDAGHEVTLLHRGKSGPELFAQAEHRIADRDDEGALTAALAAGEWDAAIDTSAYVPRQVRTLAQALAGRVGQYQLVSSISVYADFDRPVTDENTPLKTLDDPSTEAVTGASYGGLKVLCEEQAQAGFAGRCLIVRPGLIVGPHDPTGRYTWWVQRVARGGAVLAPGAPGDAVQCIDARDLAAWQLLQAERGSTGIFNLSGPVQPTTMGELLTTAVQALHSDAQFTWVDEAFLLREGVAPWSDLPLWLPRESAYMHRTDIQRAIASGLQCRPMAQTVADTAAWAATAPPPVLGGPMRPSVGLGAQREADLLAAYAQEPRTA
jgi:2'-hydroxyisoflavone reductase